MEREKEWILPPRPMEPNIQEANMWLELLLPIAEKYFSDVYVEESTIGHPGKILMRDSGAWKSAINIDDNIYDVSVVLKTTTGRHMEHMIKIEKSLSDPTFDPQWVIDEVENQIKKRAR